MSLRHLAEPQSLKACVLYLFFTLRYHPTGRANRNVWTNKEKVPLNHPEDPIEANGEESGDPVRYPLLTLEKSQELGNTRDFQNWSWVGHDWSQRPRHSYWKTFSPTFSLSPYWAILREAAVAGESWASFSAFKTMLLKSHYWFPIGFPYCILEEKLHYTQQYSSIFLIEGLFFPPPSKPGLKWDSRIEHRCYRKSGHGLIWDKPQGVA